MADKIYAIPNGEVIIDRQQLFQTPVDIPALKLHLLFILGSQYLAPVLLGQGHS